MKLLLIAISTLLLVSSYASGQSISMTVNGMRMGKFKAENARQIPDKIDVLAATMEVVTSTDAASGLTRGRRQHQPLILRKMAGASSPQFFQALTTNESLTNVVIEFTSTNQYGEQGVNYVISLEGVRVVGFKQSASTPETTPGLKMAASSGAQLIDEIKLIYNKITVTSRTGNTEATDDNSRI